MLRQHTCPTLQFRHGIRYLFMLCHAFAFFVFLAYHNFYSSIFYGILVDISLCVYFIRV